MTTCIVTLTSIYRNLTFVADSLEASIPPILNSNCLKNGSLNAMDVASPLKLYPNIKGRASNDIMLPEYTSNYDHDNKNDSKYDHDDKNDSDDDDDNDDDHEDIVMMITKYYTSNLIIYSTYRREIHHEVDQLIYKA